MKKKYQKPETKAIEIDIDQTLLAGSYPGYGDGDGNDYELPGDGYYN